MLNLLFITANLSMEFERLLGGKFIPGHPMMQTPLGQTLVNVFQLHNSGRQLEAHYELLRLGFFLRQLKDLENGNPGALNIYKKEICHVGPTDGFFGIRFEVNIAASLARKGVRFEKQESPDFKLYGTRVAIECGSIRIRGTVPKTDYIYKIGSCIHKKEKRIYCNAETALFIDITNMVYTQNILPNLLEKSEIQDVALKSACPKISFGSFVMFNYLFNLDENSIQSVYIRADHPCIGSELKTFMDLHFPFGNEYIPHVVFPAEG